MSRIEIGSTIPELLKDSREEEFLSAFFRELEKGEVRYCVLRNYENLPHSLGGGDLDIFVVPEDVCRVEEVLLVLVQKLRMKIIQSFFTSHVIGYTLVWKEFSLGAPGVHIDIIQKFVWLGVEFVSHKELLGRQKKHGAISVAHPLYGAFISLIDRLLWGGNIEEKQEVSVVNTLVEHEEDWSRLLCVVFGASSSRQILDKFKNGEFRYLLDHRSRLRWKSLLHGFLRSPGKVVSGFILHYYRQFLNLFHRRGFFVALIGPDGAGKSTIVEGLEKCFLRLHLTTRVFHWRPFLFKPLRDLTRMVVPDKAPKPSRTSGTVVSFLRLVYYTADYMIGYLVRVLPALRRGGIVIFDRYFYDYFVDPERVRTSFLAHAPRLLYRLIPHPNAVILVYATPENIHKRKSELPLWEIDRQLGAFHNLSTFVRPLLVVSTDGDPSDSTRTALKILFSQMQRRTVRFSLKPLPLVLHIPRAVRRMIRFAENRVLDFLQPLSKFSLVGSSLLPGTERFWLRHLGSVVKRSARLVGPIKVDDPSLFQVNQRASVKGIELQGPICCLIDHDGNASKLVLNVDTIVTEKNLYQGSDREEKAVTFSIDIDGAVGLAHVPRNEFVELEPFWNERERAERLFSLFKSYRIPTVWNLCGHLFLPECTGEHRYNEKEWYGDWFLFDPGTNYHDDPGWYMPDFVKTLMEEPLFEIGYHSFGHFTYSRCSRQTTEKDLEFASWLRKEYQLPLQSFIFPHGTIGYVDEILKSGFRNLRGIFGRRAAARTIDFGNFMFFCTSRALDSFTIDWSIRNIDEIQGKNFNYYTHVWDWRTEPDFQRLERFLHRLATLNAQGRIRLQCMNHQ